MKVLLSVENYPILSGYKVVSPLNGESVLDLAFLDDGECEEIICDNVLCYVPLEHLYQYISLIVRKLQHKGKLTIIGDDLSSITHEYYFGRIDTAQYNQILFGSKKHAWDFKQSSVSLNEVYEVLSSLNLNIVSRKLHNLKFSVVSERN